MTRQWRSRVKGRQPHDWKGKDLAYVCAAIRSGATATSVAETMGVSREWIRVIWTRETGQPIPAMRRTRDMETVRIRRFWARVRVEESGCWLWTGTRNPVSGYGQVRYNGMPLYPHRLAYEMTKGPIPAGLTLDHLCRVPLCVNPDHLEAVTHRENILRSPIAVAAINARKTHCIRGHPFDAENTRRRGTHRECRACGRERESARRRREIAA